MFNLVVPAANLNREPKNTASPNTSIPAAGTPTSKAIAASSPVNSIPASWYSLKISGAIIVSAAAKAPNAPPIFASLRYFLETSITTFSSGVKLSIPLLRRVLNQSSSKALAPTAASAPSSTVPGNKATGSNLLLFLKLPIFRVVLVKVSFNAALPALVKAVLPAVAIKPPASASPTVKAAG